MFLEEQMDDHRDIGVSPPTEETLWTDTFYLLHSIKSRGRSPYITTIYGNDNLGGIERKVFTPDEENGLVVRSVLFYAPDFCLSEDRAWWATMTFARKIHGFSLSTFRGLLLHTI